MTTRIHTGAGGHVNMKSATKKKGPGRKGKAAEEPAPEHATPEQAPAETVEQTPPEADATPKTEPKAGKAKKSKKEKVAKPRKVSAIDAAARVLGETGQPMTCGAMIEAMAAKGYWKSPGGQTPAATLYSAILREIGKKGKESRFKKTERAKFAAA